MFKFLKRFVSGSFKADKKNKSKSSSVAAKSKSSSNEKPVIKSK